MVTESQRGDEAQLYLRHHDQLVRAVSRAVNASHALIEDACQTAWAILLRRQPDRGPTLFAWLRTVAVHEAYRLSQQERRDASLEELSVDGARDTLHPVASLDDAIEARRALQTLAALPASQRDDLALFVAGFGYREIGRLGHRRPRSTNNVNKHLVKARAAIRRLEAAA